MKDNSSQSENNFKQKHRIKKRWLEVIIVLSCIVVFCTTYALILPAITLEQDTYCGIEEHTHTYECYETVKVCDHGDSTDQIGERVLVCGHEGEEDGKTEKVLVCDLSEEDGHVHDGSCYEEIITEPHVHTDDCYHTHTEECFEEKLVCEKTVHEHDLACYSNPELKEHSDNWEAILSGIALTDVWSDNLVAVAESQLGYAESTENYVVAEDGETIKGYTRYGDWYADEYGLGDEVKYGDWSAAFVSYCLKFANISDEYVPRDNDVACLLEKVKNNTLASGAITYIPVSEACLTCETEDLGVSLVPEDEIVEFVPDGDANEGADDIGEFVPDEAVANVHVESNENVETVAKTLEQRTCIQKGDLVFFDSNLSNTVDSVGIICDVNADDNTITVIKGDECDCVNSAVYDFYDGTITGFGMLPENPDVIQDDTNQADATEENKTSVSNATAIINSDEEFEVPILKGLNSATTIALIKKAKTSKETDIVTEYSGSSALNAALAQIDKYENDEEAKYEKRGTYIVVFVKSYSLSGNDAAAFNSKGGKAEKITFSGKYSNGSITSSNATVNMGSYTYTLQTNTTFQYIAMTTTASTIFYGAGFDFTMGAEITMTDYVSLYGGMAGSCTPDYTDDEDGATTITILGGMYKLIVGGNEGTTKFTGNINLYCNSVTVGKPNSDSACIYAAQYYGDPAYFPSSNVVNATFENVRAGTQYYNPYYTAYGEYYLYDCRPNPNNVVNLYDMSYLTDEQILEKLSRPESLYATVNLTIIDCDMPMQIDCRGTGTTLYAGGHIATIYADQMAGAIIAVHRMEMLENSSFYQGVEYKGDAVFKNFVVHTDFVLHDNAAYQINTGESIKNWYIGNNLIMENDSSIRMGGGGYRGSILVNNDVIVTGETYFTLYDGQDYVWEIVPLTVPNGTIKLNDNDDYGRFNLDVTYLGNHFAKGQVLVDLSSSEKLEASIVLSDGVRFTIEADENNYDIIYGDYKDYVYDLTYKESVSISQMLEELNAFYPLTFFEGAYASGGNVTVNFANDLVTVNDASKDFFIKDNYISLNKGSASLKIYLNHAHVISSADENIKLRLMNFNSGITSQGVGVAEFYNIYDAVDGKRNATSYTHNLNLGKTLGTDGSPYSVSSGSLKNIFDPDKSSDYVREDYTINGNTGLFIKDSGGYYHYDSSEYSAYYNKNTGDFDLLNYHTVRYNEDGSGSTTQASFYPFNLATSQTNVIQKGSAYWYNKSTNTLMLSRNKVDFWFGLNMEFDFQMDGAGGSTVSSTGDDKTFVFRGSDDCLVYIDGVLISGITGRTTVDTVTINFTTGTVTDSGSGGGTTSLKELYTAAGREGATEWNGNTFAAGSLHTLKMYTTERDGDMKDLYMRFNLEPLVTKEINVTKTIDYTDLSEEEKAAVDAGFTDYTFVMTEKIDEKEKAVANRQYSLSSDPTKAYYTDENGKFTLKKDETATFKIVCDETKTSQEYTFTEEEKTPVTLSDKGISMNTPAWTVWDTKTDGYSVTVDIKPQSSEFDVIDAVCTNTFKVGTFITKTINVTKKVDYTGMPSWVKTTYANNEYTFTIKDSDGIALSNQKYTKGGESFTTSASGQFKLKDGETATFTIYVDPEATGSIIYKFQEANTITSKTQDGYKVAAKVPQWKLGTVVKANSWSYDTLDISSGTDFSITCLNRFTATEVPYTLTVKKNVIGQTTTGTFNFELEVKDSGGNAVDMTSKKATLTSLGVTIKTGTTNVLQFILKDGESKTFNSSSWIIPKGSNLTLTEIDHDGYLTTMEISDIGKYSVDTYTFDFNKSYTVNVVNTQGTVLPRTGGRGTILYIIGGLLILAGAFVYGYMLRRRCRGGPSG